MMIYCIAEGHGELAALPSLIRRLYSERFNRHDITIPSVYRLPRGRFEKPDDLKKPISLGTFRINDYGKRGALLFVCDADEECAVKLSKSVSNYISELAGDTLFSVVICVREFENWLLASAHRYNELKNCNPVIDEVKHPESINNPKSYFSKFVMTNGYKYRETVDQVRFSNAINIDDAYNKCRSFRKFFSEMEKISSKFPCAE